MARLTVDVTLTSEKKWFFPAVFYLFGVLSSVRLMSTDRAAQLIVRFGMRISADLA